MNALPPIDPLLVFSSTGPDSMADVLGRAEAEMTGTKHRDTVSGFSSAAKALGVDWQAVPATPTALRDLLNSRCAAELGLSDRRWSNICSLIRGAFDQFGTFERSVTKRIPLTDAWVSLLASVPKIQKHWKDGLTRLACYCSALQVAPSGVTQEILLTFYEALVEEEVVRDPKRLLKHTIACWNMCRKDVAGWPEIRLASPFASTAYRIPLDRFPQGFQEDLSRWQERVLKPDIFDENSAPRALKVVTVNGQVQRLIRFASALVHEDLIMIDQITGLDVLVMDFERLKSGLRYFLDRNDGNANANLSAITAILRAVAKHHVCVDDHVQKKIDSLSANLRLPRADTLTSKNRSLLRQFDTPENVKKLLNYPNSEAARGRKAINPHRRAKCFERAVAVALLISTMMRAKNIRTIRLNTDLQWADGSCYLSIPGDRVKNGVPLEFAIPPDVSALITEYIQDYRPLLPGSDSVYLFPAQDGSPRPHNSLFDGLTSNLLKRTGLQMNPHLFRHALAKIVVERNPGMALSISRQLGHKRIDTTMQHYLGTEGRVVSRRIDEIVSEARTPAFDIRRRG